MKKRLFAMLLVIIMVLQFVPVSAETVQNISTAEDLYALNNNLDANVILMNDITLNIDDAFALANGAYIGSNANPFTGKINGNGKTIYLNVDTDLADWAIFYSMKNAEVTNLKIVLQDFYSSSNSSNVSLSLLAHEIENCSITTSFSITANLTTPFWGTRNGRNIDVGLVAIHAKNTNKINLGSSTIYANRIPYHANVRAGAIVEANGISANSSKLTVSATKFSLSVPANDNSYLAGAVAETTGSLEATFSGAFHVVYANPGTTFNASNKNQTTNVSMGSAVGKNGSNVTVTAGGDYDCTLSSLGVVDTFNNGAVIGSNAGTFVGRYFTSVLEIESSVSDTISFIDNFNTSNSQLNIGGVVGNSSGYTHIHSNGVNVMSEGLIVKNSKINFGSFIGIASGSAVKIDNNGVYLYSPEIVIGQGSYLGNMIGRDNGVNNMTIRYNIINATDKHSFKTDYSWIQNPIGNVHTSTKMSNFRYNYWAYMDYAILNVPTQIYFTFPMNYYGDNPPLETSTEYPFLATYSYLYPNQETNQYLSFQNASGTGIGKVLLTKDCVASVKVAFDVINEHAEGIWGGHVYQNPDVLNRFETGDDSDGDGVDDGYDILEGFDVPPPNPKPNGATLVDVYFYVNNINGYQYSCKRYEYSDGSWHENCVDESGKNGLTNEGGGTENPGGPTNPGDSDTSDETIVFDPNHNNPDYTCVLEKRADAWYEVCTKNPSDYVYDRHHGQSGYTCWFDKIGNTYYETCEKDDNPEYFYDVNHGRSGYTCWFDKYGNDYYETCEKNQPEYIYDKHHGEAGYKCDFNLRNGNYYETCIKIEEETPEGWDKDFVKSGFAQAVVNKGQYAGMPLPTYTENKKSEVTFNYHDLSYEIKYTNNTFNDIKGHRFENEMIEAANRLIIKGYGDGTFGPNRDITRAEFATMVVRTLGLLPSSNGSFDDVKAGSWYYEFVNTAADWGIVVGIGNNLFAPERNITRQEAAIMLMRAAKILEEQEFEAKRKQLYEVEFYGWENSAMWARTEVIESVLYDIMGLRDGKQFEPLANITRAETASALLNLLKNFELINK